ncbi:hypothetical protein NP493_239g01019 [Ridgeia piscesae]|uniref:Uncharacterized protein n=1 Tax=Ridgeia piscesae TaxID=27915 RepID=A0AAD9UDI9_RIDPI|nr:hypothetical protein NP493_239g01019 [Ridgeia piscesae]
MCHQSLSIASLSWDISYHRLASSLNSPSFVTFSLVSRTVSVLSSVVLLSGPDLLLGKPCDVWLSSPQQSVTDLSAACCLWTISRRNFSMSSWLMCTKTIPLMRLSVSSTLDNDGV